MNIFCGGRRPQTWQLGLQRRSRYIDSGFLRAEYSYQEVFARSTDVDRCLMSAQVWCIPEGVGVCLHVVLVLSVACV